MGVRNVWLRKTENFAGKNMIIKTCASCSLGLSDGQILEDGELPPLMRSISKKEAWVAELNSDPGQF